MAATTIGLYFNVDPLQIKAAIESYTPSNLRSQLLQTERNKIILDAYNANPSSMQAALQHFATLPANNKLIIIGEMRELGTFSTEAHQRLLELIAEKQFHRAILVGKNFEILASKYTFATYFEDTENLIDYLKSHPLSDTFILIKGSRGNQLERIVEYL